MHQYKVHLPKQSNFECDTEEWFDRSYTDGIYRDFRNLDDETINPSSLDDIPIDIGGSFTE